MCGAPCSVNILLRREDRIQGCSLIHAKHEYFTLIRYNFIHQNSVMPPFKDKSCDKCIICVAKHSSRALWTRTQLIPSYVTLCRRIVCQSLHSGSASRRQWSASSLKEHHPRDVSRGFLTQVYVRVEQQCAGVREYKCPAFAPWVVQCGIWESLKQRIEAAVYSKLTQLRTISA